MREIALCQIIFITKGFITKGFIKNPKGTNNDIFLFYPPCVSSFDSNYEISVSFYFIFAAFF